MVQVMKGFLEVEKRHAIKVLALYTVRSAPEKAGKLGGPGACVGWYVSLEAEVCRGESPNFDRGKEGILSGTPFLFSEKTSPSAHLMLRLQPLFPKEKASPMQPNFLHEQ